MVLIRSQGCEKTAKKDARTVKFLRFDELSHGGKNSSPAFNKGE